MATVPTPKLDPKTTTSQARRVRSLLKLSSAQRELGSLDAALAPAQEALALARGLVQVRPETFLPEVATALEQCSGILGDLGRHDEALVGAMEALDIYRGLAKSRPNVHVPRLAMSLHSVSVQLRHLGRHQEALPLARGAAEWLWPYCVGTPEVHGKQMANILELLATLHADLGIPMDMVWADRFQNVTARLARDAKAQVQDRVAEKKPASRKRRENKLRK